MKANEKGREQLIKMQVDKDVLPEKQEQLREIRNFGRSRQFELKNKKSESCGSLKRKLVIRFQGKMIKKGSIDTNYKLCNQRWYQSDRC